VSTQQRKLEEVKRKVGEAAKEYEKRLGSCSYPTIVLQRSVDAWWYILLEVEENLGTSAAPYFLLAKV